MAGASDVVQPPPPPSDGGLIDVKDWDLFNDGLPPLKEGIPWPKEDSLAGPPELLDLTDIDDRKLFDSGLPALKEGIPFPWEDSVPGVPKLPKLTHIDDLTWLPELPKLADIDNRTRPVEIKVNGEKWKLDPNRYRLDPITGRVQEHEWVKGERHAIKAFNNRAMVRHQQTALPPPPKPSVRQPSRSPPRSPVWVAPPGPDQAPTPNTAPITASTAIPALPMPPLLYLEPPSQLPSLSPLRSGYLPSDLPSEPTLPSAQVLTPTPVWAPTRVQAPKSVPTPSRITAPTPMWTSASSRASRPTLCLDPALTLAPAPVMSPPATPTKREKGKAWKKVEDDAAIKHMGNILAEGKIQNEARFEEVARRLQKEGYARGKGAVKNRWNRRLRAVSDIDERRKRKFSPKIYDQSKKKAKIKKEEEREGERERERVVSAIDTLPELPPSSAFSPDLF